ncbi:hypothetical protein [Kitasatospora sp. NPDC051914]|uniref:hypothetical protein n=1 Tax=Kitasatospora sp. NPDC051914 TaxID=3154945 RepID=UPI003444BB5F
MTTTDLEQHLVLVDELLAQPFPERHVSGTTGHAGPDHRVHFLKQSQDFWDDEDGRALIAADAEMQACLDALVAALAARWGDPISVDLRPYLKAGCEGEEVPEPIGFLSQLAGSMQAWPLPGTGRWLAIAVGQGDKELPLELVAVVGMSAVLDPAAAERP